MRFKLRKMNNYKNKDIKLVFVRSNHSKNQVKTIKLGSLRDTNNKK